MPSLFVIRGNDQGTRFELDENPLSVGRDASSRFQLRDSEVSRHHAEFRWTDGVHTIVDLGSSNGTFVNGRRVKQHRLASGDQVQVGRTLMLYTGPADQRDAGLEGSVDITSALLPDDQSRIVHAVSHTEGSRFLQLSGDAKQNAWLARARSNLQVMYRTALAVSHTLDIDQLLNRILDLVLRALEAREAGAASH